MARGPIQAGRNMTRRGLFVLALQFGLVGTLGWRMRQLQVEDAERYRLLAEENRININLLPPPRGLIFDRRGQPIAVNEQNYRIVMVREQAGDEQAVLDRLSDLVPISPERKERVLKDMRDRPPFVPVAVVEHLKWEEFARVASNIPALPGVKPEVGLSRYYPYGPEFAHLVGYVGPVSDWDLSQIDRPDPLLQIPDFQIGKTGVEKRLEGNLRGEAGTSRIEVNAVGRVIRELDRADGRPGSDLQLTVDRDLQSYALARMNGESAATVVMDIRSGEILAMASSPSFDPNSFVFGISSKDWKALNEDEYRPMYNKTVSGVYPPGSTFKMVVALAALEAGVVGPEETFYCNGGLQLGDRRFHCWKRWGHGHVDLHDSLKHSCDVYYYEVSQRVGIERITEMARKLGLGDAPEIALPAVAGGLTPTKGWKQAVHGQSWLVGDTLNASIGQGYVLASPLQLATMTARIATGKAVTPQLTRQAVGTPAAAPDLADLDISEASLRRVRNAMFAVSNHRRGTAWRARIADKTMAMSGKTGTSQVRRITEAERRAGVFRNEDLPWNRRDHALFVAFAPHDDPKYAISVVVEHGGGGSKAAAPIARDVMIRALYGADAPLEAWPEAVREEIEQQRRTPPASAEVPGGSDRA
ncbi:MAG: penicillin-binding protein 2 [Pseudomonadota bacterium]